MDRRFQVKSPGPYELEIRVPETNDTSPPQKFIVTPSNPELDNTRPDYDLMYRLASEADMVLPRMDPTAQVKLRAGLIRPILSDAGLAEAPVTPDAKDKKAASAEDKPRLYFDLANAELIPSCMKADSQDAKSFGPVTDRWDDGFTLWQHPDQNLLGAGCRGRTAVDRVVDAEVVAAGIRIRPSALGARPLAA